MTIACLVIVGTLCAPYYDGSIVVEHSSMVGSVDIKTDDWVVAQELSSDCGGCEPDKAKFIPICANDECISYFRRCDDAVHPTVCEYFFDKYPPVDITAKTESDFQHAVALIGLVSAKARTGNFLFSAFFKEGPGPYTGYAKPPTNYMRTPASQEGTK